MTTSKPPGSIPFAYFTSLLRGLSACPGQKSEQGHSPAYRVFERWTQDLRRRFGPLPCGTTHTVLRLLFPEYDRPRVYGMQESLLAQALAAVFGLREGQLVDWKSGIGNGSLGRELQAVLKRTWTEGDDYECPLAITDVCVLLDELAALCPFSHSVVRERRGCRSKKEILRALYLSLTPEDACFMTHIILKDMVPVFCAPKELHYSAALLNHNSAGYKPLSIFEAMNIWDPSRGMNRSYRVRATLAEASEAFENRTELFAYPGSVIEIPKSVKGLGCVSALKHFEKSARIWAETKYDGERAQVHVQVRPDASPHITIFSKSKRDSTLDRFGIHDTVLLALGLRGHSVPSIKKNVILDAEMVVFRYQCIDEFWRIRSLVEATARGPRALNPPVDKDTSSQNSIVSDSSDALRLGLVFFDILYLDDTCLLETSYSERRKTLEGVVNVSPGNSILAERFPISLRTGAMPAAHQLAKVFARSIASHQEGLVLKAEEAVYNDFRKPYVKLKKDYLPGYGDALDLVVVGACWERKRGGTLKVGNDVLTTFHLGVLHNKEEMALDPSVTPHFQIYFTSSYGLSRESLEEANFLIKNSDNRTYDPKAPAAMDYKYTLAKGAQRPDVLLCQPLLVEVFGAGFTKGNSKYYELRFPRIIKIFRSLERGWKECVSSSEIHKIALKSVGRDRSSKDLDDKVNAMWGIPSSPSILSSAKRRNDTELWTERLLTDEGIAHLEGRPNSPPQSPKKRMKLATLPLQSHPRRALRQSEKHTAVSAVADPLKFFEDSWALGLAGRRPRPPWSKHIPRQSRVWTLDALLYGCNWKSEGPQRDQWMRRGLMFLDPTSDEGQRNLQEMSILIQQEAHSDKARLPIYVFDLRTFQVGENGLESQAICVFE